ncbi:MAG TPA: hypothetical protein VFK37_06800 [Bacillales bacterium]|nr:hypothetical protein [Bacillales bacterium]
MVLITEDFRKEALAQKKALNRDDLEIVFVPHPIASLEDDELIANVRKAYPEIKEALKRIGFAKEVIA